MNEMTYSKLNGLLINATSSATIVILLHVVRRDMMIMKNCMLPTCSH